MEEGKEEEEGMAQRGEVNFGKHEYEKRSEKRLCIVCFPKATFGKSG